MTVVNKFNVNKQQVTLGADIIENMSANDISYDASTQYNENTVGNKLSKLEKDVIYDVTANNNGATFASLSALLSSENLSTLIPVSVRCGGMSIRFAHSSDNNYVQYRLMSNTWSTNVSNWQGVDEEPTANSKNLVKSGGVDNVFQRVYNLFSFQDLTPDGQVYGYLRANGQWSSTSDSTFTTKYYAVTKGQILIVHHGPQTVYVKYGFFTEVPTNTSTPQIVVPNTPATSSDMITSPGNGYITVSGESANQNIKCEGVLSVADITTEEDKKLQLRDNTTSYALLYKYLLLLRKNIGTQQQPNYLNLTTLSIPAATYNKTGLQSAADKKIILDSAITFETIEATGTIAGYFLEYTGVFKENSAMTTKYYAVQSGDIIKIQYSEATGYAKFGFFTEIPTSSSTPVYFEPNTYAISHDIIIVPGNGYITLSGGGDIDLKCEKPISNKTIFNRFNQEIASIKNETFFFQDLELKGQFYGYLNKNGGWSNTEEGSFWITKYYAVTEGQVLRIHHAPQNAYAKYGFFTSIPSASVSPVSYVPNTPVTEEDIITSPGNGYITVSGDRNQQQQDIRCEGKLNKNLSDLVNLSPYYNKRCLYIGDSISSNDSYYWKGYLETFYNLIHVRKKSPLAPANGGITIVPPVTEDSSATNKSIWYRCAENRMANYDFDIISLFGGTNDMAASSLIIGTMSDVPYVDNASTITSETVTDVRPQNLSLASALMGCILMLKRDFPTKEIILPTVMYSGYGNWTDSVTGKRASEAIALLQMKIANKYGLKAIPLYWDMRQESTIDVFSTDTIHPNRNGARRIVSVFVQTLCLK